MVRNAWFVDASSQFGGQRFGARVEGSFLGAYGDSGWWEGLGNQDGEFTVVLETHFDFLNCWHGNWRARRQQLGRNWQLVVLIGVT